MATINTEIEYLAGIIIFLAVLGFVSSYLPSNLQILGPFDFTYISGSMIGLAGACVVITGGPCAVALVIWSLATTLLYFVVLNTGIFFFVKPIIILPITLIFIFIMMRLARGS